MIRRNMLTAAVVVFAAVCFFIVATNGSAQSDEPARAGQFKPVMPLHSLMVEQDRHFERIIELIRNADEEDRLAKMQHEALALAEMANINGYHRGAFRHQDYRRWAKELQDMASELAGHAEGGRTDAFAGMAKQINATCKACHDKYQ